MVGGPTKSSSFPLPLPLSVLTPLLHGCWHYAHAATAADADADAAAAAAAAAAAQASPKLLRSRNLLEN